MYCSNATSYNSQNWPIFNVSGVGVYKSPASQAYSTGLPVHHVNFFTRSSLVDLTTKDVFSQLIATTVIGSEPCVQWFSQPYFFSDDSPYDLEPFSLAGPYANKDSLYTSEPLNGWFGITKNVPIQDPRNPLTLQFYALVRSFAFFQTLPWSLVGISPSVDPNQVGSAPMQPFITDQTLIPNNSFKMASQSNGLLDTIESRYSVSFSPQQFEFNGFRKVPYFNMTGSDNSAINNQFISSIQSTINKIQDVDYHAIMSSSSNDTVVAQFFSNLQNATSNLPYTGVYFQTIDNVRKSYAYEMQVGSNSVLDQVPGFQTAGFRALLQQAQLSNAFLRFSNPALGNWSISQGVRKFPSLEQALVQIPFSSYIGRTLYPLGISFLLPIFAVSLARDRESKIMDMLQMVSALFT